MFAWLLSVRWRSIALAVMTNSIVHGRRLAAVPSLPPKKSDPEIRPSPLGWAVFPPEPSKTTCSAFTRSASSQQVLTLALFRPPQPNRERATPSPSRASRPRSPPGPHSPRFCCRRCQTETRLGLPPIAWLQQRRLTAPRGTNTQNSPVPFPISIASTGPRRRGDTMGRFRVSGSHPARRQETRPSSAEP